MPILLDDIRVAAQAIFGAIELTPDPGHTVWVWYTAFPVSQSTTIRD